MPETKTGCGEGELSFQLVLQKLTQLIEISEFACAAFLVACFHLQQLLQNKPCFGGVFQRTSIGLIASVKGGGRQRVSLLSSWVEQN